MKFFGGSKNKEDKQKNKVHQKAQKLARKGQVDKAVQEWKSLLKNRSDDANIYNTIGDLYLKGKTKERAVESYQKAAGIYTKSGFTLKAIAVNKKILKVDPKNMDALTCMAGLHRERGMLTNAKECYLSLAQNHLRDGSHDKALEAYQHIVDMEPKNIRVKLGLAEIYLKENMIQEGARIYGEVIGCLLEQSRFDEAENLCGKLEKDNVSADDILGYTIRIHLARGRIDEAEASFKKVSQVFAAQPESVMLKAEILIRKGDPAAGSAALESIDRSALGETGQFAYFGLLVEVGEYEGALRVINEWREKLSESGRVEDLLAMYQSILQRDSQNLKVRNIVVDILKKLKRNTEVIDQYKAIGRIYADSGQLDEARNFYAKVLEMNVEDVEAQAFLQEAGGAAAEDVGYGDVALDTEVGGEAQEASDAKTYVIDDDLEIESFDSVTEEADAAVAEPGPGQQASPVSESASAGGAGPVRDGQTFLADNLTESDVYIKYGHFQKALSHLEKNLEVDPKHIPTHERFLEIFVEQANIQEQINTLMVLSMIYAEQADQEKCDEMLREVLALDSSHAEAQRRLNGQAAPAAAESASAPAEDLTFEFEEDENGQFATGLVGQREMPAKHAVDSGAIDELLEEATFYSENGLVEEARVIYEKILASHPDRQDVAAQLQRMGGKQEEARAGQDDVSSMFQDVSDEVFGQAPPSAPAAEAPAGVSGPHKAVEGADAYVNFADELRAEVGDPAADKKEEPLDFTAELRKEVEDSIGSDSTLFTDDDVMDVFSEFRQGVQRELGDEDHETHYNLGIAYLEMGLIDEAREEFQVASQDPKRLMDCITMIGLCHIQKGEFEAALHELEKGLAIEGRADNEYVGIQYEIANVCEILGQNDRAVQALLKIHELNAGYRDVVQKLKKLGVTGFKAAPGPAKAPIKKDKVSYL